MQKQICLLLSFTQSREVALLTCKDERLKGYFGNGTLGEYSSIWLARTLPEDGQLITLEFDPKHTKVAEENIRNAGLDYKIEVITDPALETLPTLKGRGFSDFDLIFIDADKLNNPYYLKWALGFPDQVRLLIIGDNVHNEDVIENNSDDINVHEVRQFIDLSYEESHIDSTAIQTVGIKGYDGFVL